MVTSDHNRMLDIALNHKFNLIRLLNFGIWIDSALTKHCVTYWPWPSLFAVHPCYLKKRHRIWSSTFVILNVFSFLIMLTHKFFSCFSLETCYPLCQKLYHSRGIIYILNYLRKGNVSVRVVTHAHSDY